MLLEKLGPKVCEESQVLCAAARNGLVGMEIHLPIRSTGATENAIICGTLAEENTGVWNPHTRPEILNLIAFLTKMGVASEVKTRGRRSGAIRRCMGR